MALTELVANTNKKTAPSSASKRELSIPAALLCWPKFQFWKILPGISPNWNGSPLVKCGSSAPVWHSFGLRAGSGRVGISCKEESCIRHTRERPKTSFSLVLLPCARLGQGQAACLGLCNKLCGLFQREKGEFPGCSRKLHSTHASANSPMIS